MEDASLAGLVLLALADKTTIEIAFIGCLGLRLPLMRQPVKTLCRSEPQRSSLRF